MAGSPTRWARCAIFVASCLAIAACASTPIEQSAAVQAASAAAAAVSEAETSTTSTPADLTETTDGATDSAAVEESPAETDEPELADEQDDSAVDVAELNLVEGNIAPAASESGRAPAFGGGNPQTSVADALQVSLPTVGGPQIDVSQFLGQDVVLWFWAPWCSWCNAEAPRVRELSTEFADRVEVVGVAGVSSEVSMQDFVDRHDLDHITHLADFDGHFWFNLDVTYQPWWMFVDDSGEVILNWQGRLSDEEIRNVMQQLVDL